VTRMEPTSNVEFVVATGTAAGGDLPTAVLLLVSTVLVATGRTGDGDPVSRRGRASWDSSDNTRERLGTPASRRGTSGAHLDHNGRQIRRQATGQVTWAT
jgi:hypothetical protein